MKLPPGGDRNRLSCASGVLCLDVCKRFLPDVTSVNELPLQDYDVIKEDLLNRRKSRHRDLDPERDLLWTDPVFPPDLTSLTYVYSGDDKYERMRFRRIRVSLPRDHTLVMCSPF